MNQDLIEALGYQAHLPTQWGSWGGSLALSGVILLLWFLWNRANERSGRFTLL